MTVAELIDELQQCEPEWRVTLDGFEIVRVGTGVNATGEDFVKLIMEDEEI